MTAAGPDAPADLRAYALAHAAQRRARRRRPRPGRPPAPAAPPRRSPAQRTGDRAERQALAHLRAAGLVLVARNVACRAGEIDLVMRDGPVLVFVEVRARAQARYGGAAASVGPAKQLRLARAAAHFLRARWKGPLPPCRFDVLAFEADTPPRWIRHAFSLEALPGWR